MRLLRKGELTMDALARESGTSRATLYRQVKNRDAVIAALKEQGVAVDEDDTQERILKASRVVFARAGFDAATLEDIAAVAGVNVATVFRQFGDKRGLITAFGTRFLPRRAVAEVAVKPSGDLRADLERIALKVLAYAAEEPDLMRIALLERVRGGEWAEAFAASPVRAQPMLAKLLRHYRKELKDEPFDQLARIFAGMMFSSILAPIFDGQAAPDPEASATLLTRVFLQGAMS